MLHQDLQRIGVPLFKEPRVKRAKRTEMLLGFILGAMLLGLAVLTARWHVGPRSGQTVLSQIMAMAVGRNWAFYTVSLTITLASGGTDGRACLYLYPRAIVLVQFGRQAAVFAIPVLPKQRLRERYL